ncbi:hypothetical protein [Brevibacillus choshinensis]|uniref:Uncharacterized protein n=1 Tax=Brevibacillus choshinensis TaxID=54911 RepID=A0ABR5N505_BRECH|nr:hypothetical protein [Brevibacillus choshinensis]KQL45709.1 hypothetical protein AN963_11675 [Brevibacillus choshinensis]MED4582962.1 hypothetical protein [Brevibacillus choshinensis]MED4752878.1 hypothetical protein [Brevibacillus choshinensis]MED4781546.1 hypothetical protein [Brevibacillus choshinensis]
MPITPFIITVFILVFIALILTFRIGLNPEEAKQRSFTHRSRNLLLIYGVITLLLVIALSIFLYLQ